MRINHYIKSKKTPTHIFTEALDQAFVELKANDDFLKTCAYTFGSEFFKTELGLSKRQNISLVQLAALKEPSAMVAAVTKDHSGFPQCDEVLAAVMAGYWRSNHFEKAMEFIRARTSNSTWTANVFRQVLIIDGTSLCRFSEAAHVRDYVKLAVAPGPYDEMLSIANGRPKNLRFAKEGVYRKDAGLLGFVRDLIQVGCRKKDFPSSFWTSLFSDMSHEERRAFSASVMLTPSMGGVSKLGSNLWYDLPHDVTVSFKDCSNYQCGICFGIPVMVYNCLGGCTFNCCQQCRESMPGDCPMCRADQNGDFGRRCRAAEVSSIGKISLTCFASTRILS
jgi:hypothetical protein